MGVKRMEDEPRNFSENFLDDVKDNKPGTAASEASGSEKEE